jgi:hypothetical protein
VAASSTFFGEQSGLLTEQAASEDFGDIPTALGVA